MNKDNMKKERKIDWKAWMKEGWVERKKDESKKGREERKKEKDEEKRKKRGKRKKERKPKN